MKFLISGATGCLGQNFMPQLFQAGHEAAAIIRSSKGLANHGQLKSITADLQHFQNGLFKEENFDVFIHAAAAHLAFEKDFSVNLKMTENMLKWALEAKAKHFIFISSVSIYGDLYNGERAENAAKSPDSPYGESKLQCEHLVTDFCQKNDLNYTILRPGLLYGPHDRGGISKLISMVQSGKVPIFGDGSYKKSMTSVKNISSAILQVALNPQAYKKDYIIVDPRSYTVLDHIASLESLLNKKALQVKMIKPLALAMGFWYDTKLKLGFKVPLTSFAIRKITCNNYYSSQKFEMDFPGVLRDDYKTVLADEVNWFLNQKR